MKAAEPETSTLAYKETRRCAAHDWLLFVSFPVFMFAGVYAYTQSLMLGEHPLGLGGAFIMCVTAVCIADIFHRPLQFVAGGLGIFAGIAIGIELPYGIIVTACFIALCAILGALLASNLHIRPLVMGVPSIALQALLVAGIWMSASLYAAAIIATLMLLPIVAAWLITRRSLRRTA